MSSESKGDDFMKEADKILKKFSLFGSGSKNEDAAEAFQRAGNAYKVAKQWEKASDAFVKAADLHIKMKGTHEAATHFVEAAKCAKKVNTAECIRLLTEAVTLYEELGNFSAGAKLEKEMGEICEGDGDTEEAVAHFQKAADMFGGEGSTSTANQCLLKVAHYQAKAENYSDAIAVFEDVGKAYLENDLMKFNAKGAFLNAGLCHLASGDPIAAERAIQRYQELDYTFDNSRECKLLQNIHKAFTAFNAEEFTETIASYDAVSKLDPWKTTILLRIKTAIQAAGETAVDLT